MENTCLNQLIQRYPKISVCYDDILNATNILAKSFANGKKLLVAGNGGSSADALHIVGELMKSFVLPRKVDSILSSKIDAYCKHAEYLKSNLQMALPAIALVSETGLITAYSNDVSPDLIFAQQVLGYGNVGDVFLGITTSGNSKNIIYAAELARAKGLTVLALTGETGGAMKELADVCIRVPEIETFKIQEIHLPIYHAICLELENKFFG